MRWLFILLLLAVPVTAQTIADYPYFLFNERNFTGYIIKGDLRTAEEITATNLVVNNLPKLYRPMFRILDGFNFYQMRADPTIVSKSVRLASQVSSLDRPAIIVGTPCTNEWVRKILNLSNCNIFPGDTGIVVLGTYKKQPVILVTGGSAKSVLEASEWLHSEAHFRMFRGVVFVRKQPGFDTVRIGNGDMLTIGRPIGQVTPVITVGSYPVMNTQSNTYLRFPNGKVVFGEGR